MRYNNDGRMPKRNKCRMKKILPKLCVFIAFLMLISLAPLASFAESDSVEPCLESQIGLTHSILPFPNPFDDIDDHWGKEFILYVVRHGLMHGTSPASFSPNRHVTREEFIVILGRLARIDTEQWAYYSHSLALPFVDDVPGSREAEPYIRWALSSEILQGLPVESLSDNQISRGVTRQEAVFLLDKL